MEAQGYHDEMLFTLPQRDDQSARRGGKTIRRCTWFWQYTVSQYFTVMALILYSKFYFYCFHVILWNGRRTTNCQGMYAKWSPEHAIKDWFAAQPINVWMPVINSICSQSPASLQPSGVRTTIATHLATLKNNNSHVIVVMWCTLFT